MNTDVHRYKGFLSVFIRAYAWFQIIRQQKLFPHQFWIFFWIEPAFSILIHAPDITIFTQMRPCIVRTVAVNMLFECVPIFSIVQSLVVSFARGIYYPRNWCFSSRSAHFR